MIFQLILYLSQSLICLIMRLSWFLSLFFLILLIIIELYSLSEGSGVWIVNIVNDFRPVFVISIVVVMVGAALNSILFVKFVNAS